MESLSMKWVLAIFLVFSCWCLTAAQYQLEIGKKMENGDPIKTPVIITLEPTLDIAGIPDLRVKYDMGIPSGYLEVLETTIYFANADKEITQITFTDGMMTPMMWSKPWKFLKGGSAVNDAGISATKADVSVPVGLLPIHTIKVSGSIKVKDLDGLPVVLNHYGIKNYDISVEGGDPLIVESYMPANLTSITSA